MAGTCWPATPRWSRRRWRRSGLTWITWRRCLPKAPQAEFYFPADPIHECATRHRRFSLYSLEYHESPPMTPLQRCACLLLFSLLLAGPAAAAPLRIAAAADLAPCMPALNAGFDGETSVTSGASGNFYAQIRNGAPFDILMSADTGYPLALADAGLADGSSMVVYALGQLVLWSADPRLHAASGLQLLTDPAVRRIA